MKKLFYSLACFASFGAIQAQTVFDVIETSPDHGILEQAINTAGLASTLDDPMGDFTVFAPTDSAFNAFFANNNLTAAAVLADPELSTILLHHVVGGTVTSSMLSNGEVTTLSDLDVTVTTSPHVLIDSAKVTGADVFLQRMELFM